MSVRLIKPALKLLWVVKQCDGPHRQYSNKQEPHSSEKMDLSSVLALVLVCFGIGSGNLGLQFSALQVDSDVQVYHEDHKVCWQSRDDMVAAIFLRRRKLKTQGSPAGDRCAV